jgi:hypothetical protein
MEVTMKVVRTDETVDTTAWVPLPDVSGESVELLDRDDESVLGRCLDQIMRSIDDPNGLLSAFSSFVSES